MLIFHIAYLQAKVLVIDDLNLSKRSQPNDNIKLLKTIKDNVMINNEEVVLVNEKNDFRLSSKDVGLDQSNESELKDKAVEIDTPVIEQTELSKKLENYEKSVHDLQNLVRRNDESTSNLSLKNNTGLYNNNTGSDNIPSSNNNNKDNTEDEKTKNTGPHGNINNFPMHYDLNDLSPFNSNLNTKIPLNLSGLPITTLKPHSTDRSIKPNTNNNTTEPTKPDKKNNISMKQMNDILNSFKKELSKISNKNTFDLLQNQKDPTFTGNQLPGGVYNAPSFVNNTLPRLPTQIPVGDSSQLPNMPYQMPTSNINNVMPRLPTQIPSSSDLNYDLDDFKYKPLDTQTSSKYPSKFYSDPYKKLNYENEVLNDTLEDRLTYAKLKERNNLMKAIDNRKQYIQMKLQEIKANKDKLILEMNLYRSKLSNIISQIRNIKKVQDTYTNKINSNRSHIYNLSKNNEQVNEKKEQVISLIRITKNEVQRYRNLLENETDKLDMLEKQYEVYEDTLKKYNDNIDTEKQKLSNLKRELQKNGIDIDNLQDLYRQYNDKNQKIEEELKRYDQIASCLDLEEKKVARNVIDGNLV